MKTVDDILRFWFVEHGMADWFGAKPEFDYELARRFTDTHAAVARGEASWWRGWPEGRLAEILVLDQFSRQLFRGKAEAFASDPTALRCAEEAVATGADLRIEPRHRLFLYLPYTHSEDLKVHDEAVRLFGTLGGGPALKAELEHIDVLKRFGRYPRRNAALGRESTPEEAAYIAAGTGMV